ncbi:FAD-binding oxidoreductase [Quadrisphaera sp. DSM 44207]|uniref:FAD-binding oxidoreductase n=1 Tax=Quadrisphaera sp. DSM 44207 TaxID=1881057 RepID=UPI00088BA202|nr:FAD-binding oxidoreductase [Quadrisphaera sp. DSM 44207]SDQ49102.1 Ferredoxin-NADP reductase [Quadrisphaera sp. DSM 44207]
MSGPALRQPPVGGARRPWQHCRVVAVRPETPHARTLRLALPVWNPHAPGQHYVVRLTAPDGYRAERSYSVASPPEDAGHIELTVERLADGEVSPHLHDAVEVGDELEVRGPFGGWFVWDGARPAVLVGGGSGVVPLMAMLRSRRARGLGVPLRMVVSARSLEDLLYRDEYGEETTVVLTRAVPAGWPRPPGRLSAADLALALLPGATVYVCGSAGFAGTAERLLAGLGVAPGDVRVERFGPS